MGTEYEYVCSDCKDKPEVASVRELGKGHPRFFARLLVVAPDLLAPVFTLEIPDGDAYGAMFGYGCSGAAWFLVEHRGHHVSLKDDYGYFYDIHGKRVCPGGHKFVEDWVPNAPPERKRCEQCHEVDS